MLKIIEPSQKSNDNPADKSPKGKPGLSAEPSHQEKIKIMEAEKARLKRELNQSNENWLKTVNEIDATEQKGDFVSKSIKRLEKIKLGKAAETLNELDLATIVLKYAEMGKKDFFDFYWRSWMILNFKKNTIVLFQAMVTLFQEKKVIACKEIIALIRQRFFEIESGYLNMQKIIKRSPEVAKKYSNYLQEVNEKHKKEFTIFDEVEKFLEKNKHIDEKTWQKKAKPILEKIAECINIINWALKGMPPELIRKGLENLQNSS